MRLSHKLTALAAFAAAAALAAVVAALSATVIEQRATSAVAARLADAGITWASVSADGLQVHLAGTAPNEAARFRAVNLAGAEVDAARVRDGLDVTPARAIEAPRFSVEILRNDSEIQVIGLLPEETDRAALAARMTGMAPGGTVTDMLETAAYPAPDGWQVALDFGLAALEMLPRAKISVATDRVAITAIADSDSEKRRLETEIARLRPKDLTIAFDIAAPRPVLTPFTLRFLIDAEGARFDACAADSEAARDRILAAAVAAGIAGKTTCTLGLGVPSPRWGEAAAAGIAAVAALGQGTITFSDADVTLLATEAADQALFDRVVGDLGATLPDAFSLSATLPKKAEAAPQGPAEFTASLAAETGRAELRGRLTDEALRAAVDSYARARFGVGKVYIATRMDEGLPEGWPLRVLTGLEALSLLDHGSLRVRADTVEVTGVTGSQAVRARLSQLLSGKLGKGQTFRVDVRYDEALDPLAALPTPEECAADVRGALLQQKITFTPGSAEIDAAARPLMDALAAILKNCAGIQMEISGHTDSQGSEGGNLALSQARAEAVLVALQGRRVDVSGMSAKGYGEARPLADNKTDAGREANRRIEFTLQGAAQGGDAAQGAATPPAGAANAAALAANGPDFSADTSPSIAPTEMILRPRARRVPGRPPFN